MTLLFTPVDIQLDNLLDYTRPSTLKKVAPSLAVPDWWDTVVLDQPSLLRFENIIKQLPYDNLLVVRHKFQNAPVGIHVDVNHYMKTISPEELASIQDSEPCGYRVVINGKPDALEIFDGANWIAPVLPTMPCCYLINSTRLQHRVKDDPGREILYFRGIVNKERNQQLIKRSLEKYKDHAVYLK